MVASKKLATIYFSLLVCHYTVISSKDYPKVFIYPII